MRHFSDPFYGFHPLSFGFCENPKWEEKCEKNRKLFQTEIPFPKSWRWKIEGIKFFCFCLIFGIFRRQILSLHLLSLVSCSNFNGYIEFHHILSHTLLSSSQILILVFRHILLFCFPNLICVFLAVFSIKGRRRANNHTHTHKAYRKWQNPFYPLLSFGVWLYIRRFSFHNG